MPVTSNAIQGNPPEPLSMVMSSRAGRLGEQATCPAVVKKTNLTLSFVKKMPPTSNPYKFNVLQENGVELPRVDN